MEWLPLVGRQQVDLLGWMARSNAWQHIFEPFYGINAVQPARCQERVEGGHLIGCVVGSAEEVVLAADCDRAHGPFDGVGDQGKSNH